MARIIYINARKKIVLFSLVLLILISPIAFFYWKDDGNAAVVSATENKVSNFGNLWLGLINLTFPFGLPAKLEQGAFLDRIVAVLAQTNIGEPKKMLAEQLLAAPGKEEWYITEPENEDILIPVPKKEEAIEQLPPMEKPVQGKPLVGIYCTHNAETYQLSDGVEKVEGKNGGVMTAAARLKTALENKGIGAVLDTTIHDYPNWPSSYRNSLITAQKLLKDYPSIQILIDVHRDAMPSRESSICKINGQNVARISFIVGSDTRLPHPNWRKNWAYANFLAEQMEKEYPGLLRSVRVQSGRYNQHVSPHAILIEVGSTKNSLPEAERAMDLFAKVLADSIAAKR